MGKKVVEDFIRLNNTRTLYQIMKNVLKEIINDISQIDFNGVIKTAM